MPLTANVMKNSPFNNLVVSRLMSRRWCAFAENPEHTQTQTAQ